MLIAYYRHEVEKTIRSLRCITNKFIVNAHLFSSKVCIEIVCSQSYVLHILLREAFFNRASLDMGKTCISLCDPEYVTVQHRQNTEEVDYSIFLRGV